MSLLMVGNKAYAQGDFTESRAWTCLTSALGITAIRTIISTTTALTTEAVLSTGLKILNYVGLRYLGYFGLVVAVIQFTKCVSS